MFGKITSSNSPLFTKRAVLIGLTVFFFNVSNFCIVPVLPIFLSKRHIGYLSIGIIIAGFYIFAVIGQFLLARAVDKGYKALILKTSVFIFLFSVTGFFFNAGFFIDFLSRCLQGAAFGAFGVASNSLILDTVPDTHKARGFSVISATTTLGAAIGPIWGATFILHHPDITFSGSYFAAAASLLISFGITRSSKKNIIIKSRENIYKRSSGALALIGTCLFMASGGLIAGMYDISWSPLMILRHATGIQIGLSWSTYCLPFVIISGYAAKAADKYNTKNLALVSGTVMSGFAALYPFIPGIYPLIGAAPFEALGASFGYPSSQKLLFDYNDRNNSGRLLSIVLAVQTIFSGLGALVSGFLIAKNIKLAFMFAGFLGFLLVLLAFLLWNLARKRLNTYSKL
jgi:MFS family permease